MTSNDGSDVNPPIFRLPTELTVLIFKQCGSQIRPRLTLTHTCRRWRQIAVNNASLWTKIRIKTGFMRTNPRLDYFISILGMQLDRTANLLLDVEWIAWADNFYVATLQLLREKAPFSRWRSLRVNILGFHDKALWSSAGEFTNLKTLAVSDNCDVAISNVIDDTITARLRVLEVTWPHVLPTNIMKCFANSLTHVSSLRLHSLYPTHHHGPFLPANVINLDLDYGRQHPFPHIQTYKLKACTFAGNDDLRSMTTLIVSGHLVINPNVQVSLPALRELTLETLEIGLSAVFEAPALKSLHFTKIGLRNDVGPVTRTQTSLLQQGYLLSPNTSVTADSHLPSAALITLLDRSPKVIDATLRFEAWSGAQVVLGRLLGFKTETRSYSSENEPLCPRLSKLRLDFSWELSEPSESKEWLLDVLRSQKATSLIMPLSISATWAGYGTYVRLTCD